MVQLFFGGSFEFLLEGLEQVGNGKTKDGDAGREGRGQEREGTSMKGAQTRLLSLLLFCFSYSNPPLPRVTSLKH